jgi:hypothetical protein
MGTGAKVLLILGIIFAILIVLCCGGMGVMYYSMKSAMKISNDPAAIKALTKEIAEIDVPEPLKPQMSMNMKVPFSDKTLMKFVGYNDAPNQDTLLLVAMGDMFTGQNQEQMQQSFEQSLRQQGVNNKEREQLQDAKTSTKELQIGGKPAKFNIVKGQGVKTKSPRMQVSGVFQGRAGTVMLILDADTDKLSEKKIDAMLESIH